MNEEFALTLVTNEKAPAKLAAFQGALSLIAGVDFTEAKVTLSLPKFGGGGRPTAICWMSCRPWD
jgi:hypothetical protein